MRSNPNPACGGDWRRALQPSSQACDDGLLPDLPDQVLRPRCEPCHLPVMTQTISKWKKNRPAHHNRAEADQHLSQSARQFLRGMGDKPADAMNRFTRAVQVGRHGSLAARDGNDYHPRRKSAGDGITAARATWRLADGGDR
jgi:hypothetical protein